MFNEKTLIRRIFHRIFPRSKEYIEKRMEDAHVKAILSQRLFWDGSRKDFEKMRENPDDKSSTFDHRFFDTKGNMTADFREICDNESEEYKDIKKKIKEEIIKENKRP